MSRLEQVRGVGTLIAITYLLALEGPHRFRKSPNVGIDQFVAWYCSEPGLAFNRIVVVRYRMYLESRYLAANTINQQLAAVRRLAHEAADAGLLSPELAEGISRVKGVKQLGFRAGNWLSAEQSSEVLQHACGDSMRAKRDYAMLAMFPRVGEGADKQYAWPLFIRDKDRMR